MTFDRMDEGELSEVSKQTLADQVTDRLRLAIMRGVLAPGERFFPKDISKRLDVSLVPVREAIRRLEGEGLIVAHPQRGAMAADVSVAELRDIWDVRHLLEGQAIAHRSSQRMAPEDIVRMRQALEDLRSAAAASPSGSEELRLAHHSFHWSLLEPGGSPWVRRILYQLWQASDRYVELSIKLTGDADGFVKGHEELLAMAESGNARNFAEAIDDHIRATEEDVAASFDSWVSGRGEDGRHGQAGAGHDHAGSDEPGEGRHPRW